MEHPPSGNIGARSRWGELSTVALLLALLLPGLWPLVGAGTPVSHDGHLHLQRIVALDRLVHDGVLFSRWLPDLAYGYGMPLFNYYAPLVYVPAVATRLLGGSYVDSYKLTVALSFAAAAVGMYVLARGLFGRLAGLAAAIAYAYQPYLLTNIYLRGALAETAAFVWLPIGAWSILKLRADARVRWIVCLALALGALVLTHNITALFATPAFATLAILLAIRRSRGSSIGRLDYLGRVGLGCVLAAALTAWFWLPALLERSLVAIEATANDDFVSVALDAWPPFQTSPAYAYQYSLTQAPWSEKFRPLVGLVQAALILVGATAALRSRTPGRGLLGWAAGMVAVAWGLQFAVVAPLFDLIPLAGFIQFPWRLLTFVGLGSAFLSAGIVATVGSGGAPRLAAAGIVIGLSVWSAVARLVPTYEFPEDRFVTPEALVRTEMASLGVGTTAGGEFLPVTTGHPHAYRLWRELRDNDEEPTPDREAPLAYRVDVLEWSPTAVQARVSAPEAGRLFLHQFFFPGWSARVDDVPTPLQPAGRFGILAVDLPAGVHDVEFRFGSTPLRLGALAVGAAVAAGLLGMRLATSWRTRRAPVSGQLIPARVALALLVAGSTAALALRAHRGTAETHQSGQVELDGQLALVGWQLDDSRLAAGEPLMVDLEWLALSGLATRYQVSVQVEAADGTTHEARWAYGPLVRSWERGELTRTETNVRLPAEFPPGPARVELRIDRGGGNASQRVGTLPLGQIVVPDRRALADGPAFSIAAGRRIVESLALTTYELRGQGRLDPAELRAGDVLDANLQWQALGTPTQELVAALQLRGSAGEAQSAAYTIGGWFSPPKSWQTGDTFRQQLRLVISPKLAPDRYSVWLRVFGGNSNWVGLGPQTELSVRGRGRPLAEIPLGEIALVRDR